MSTPAAGKPIPAITPEMRPFFEGARRHELRVQRCRGCGALRFPARALCSACLSTDSEWIAVSGRGEIYSFNVMHQVYHPGFAAEVPYTVVLVQLAEGPRMISNLVGIDAHAVRVGMPVRVVFETLSDEVTLPKFTPA
ncbi:Zn-ribbon domain-containing OB-fold protein [bacterium]|nr:Zn-ribbon domain-containing OB-fold protein [bacterium]